MLPKKTAWMTSLKRLDGGHFSSLGRENGLASKISPEVLK